MILGSPSDSLPFLVRNNDILLQPGVDMQCDRREKTCNISLNRLLLWQPSTWSLQDEVPPLEREGMTWQLKEELKKLGQENYLTFEPAVYVTCYGVRSEDREKLGGMKLDRPGFEASGFPWSGDVKEEKPVVMLSLVESRVNSERREQEVKVNLVCQAWAKNIKTSGFPVRIPDISPRQPRHTISRNGAVTMWICFRGWQMGGTVSLQKECEYNVKN